MKMSEAIKAYQEHRAATTTASTRTNVARQFHNFQEMTRVTHIEQITQELYNRWVTKFSEGRSGGYVRRNMHNITALLKFCVRQKWLPVMPVERDLTPRVVCRDPMKYPFIQEDHDLILSICARKHRWPYWTAACIIAWHTGLRFSDVCELEWANVDWKHMLIRTLPKKVRRYGRVLTIPIEPELEAALREVETTRYCRWVNPQLYGIYQMSQQHLCNQFRNILDTAGILKCYSFHSYRHGFVTKLINAGVDYLVIASMTGHTTDEIARYAHVSDQAKRRALALARKPYEPPPIKLLEVA